MREDSGWKIEDPAPTNAAAGLKTPGGDPRLKTVMTRLLNDLFVAIDDLDISMDEVWAGVGYLAKAAPELGLVVPGIGLERFLDMRLDEAERLAGLSGGTPRAIEGPLYVAGAPVSNVEARRNACASLPLKPASSFSSAAAMIILVASDGCDSGGREVCGTFVRRHNPASLIPTNGDRNSPAMANESVPSHATAHRLVTSTISCRVKKLMPFRMRNGMRSDANATCSGTRRFFKLRAKIAMSP